MELGSREDPDRQSVAAGGYLPYLDRNALLRGVVVFVLVYALGNRRVPSNPLLSGEPALLRLSVVHSPWS